MLFSSAAEPRRLSGEAAWLFATLQVIQHLLSRGASNLHSSKFKSPCRSIGVFIRASQGFFLSPHAEDIGIILQVAFRQFLFVVPVSTPSCGLIADDSGTRRAVSLSSPSPQSVVWVCWQGRQCPAFACERSYAHSWPFLSARQMRKRDCLFESAG